MHPQFLLKTLTIVYKKDPSDFKDIIKNHMDSETIEELVNYIGTITKKSMEQELIIDQQSQIQHLTEMVDYLHSHTHSVMLHWRGIDPSSNTLCEDCDGSGTQVEKNDEENGINKKLFNPIPCRICYGSGDTANKWPPVGTLCAHGLES